MAEEGSKPLQATFDVDDYDAEVVEGTGFEPGVRYEFTLEKGATGKYMQYGAAKGGLLVLKKSCPDELAASYKRHPDQFDIFSTGEINGQQALVPGKDFEKFKPYLSKIVDVAWVHQTDSGKRLIFMTLNAGDKMSVNPGHPEWESPAVRLARKLGYEPPAAKNKDGTPNKEKFSFSFLHPGLTITSEVLTTKRKGSDRDQNVLDIDTIEVVSSDGTPASKEQQKITGNEIAPEIKMTIIELADGCENLAAVIRKVKAHLKETKQLDKMGEYSSALTRMKESKEILA